MKDDFEFQPVHAYFASVSAAAVFFIGVLCEWPLPVLSALTMVSLIFLGIGGGMVLHEARRLMLTRGKNSKGGDSIDD
ncbi:MAG: hypothetical protein ACLTCF_05440 [Eggerthellaceae bacterium]